MGQRRGAGAVERGGLENRWPFAGPVSSNLTPAVSQRRVGRGDPAAQQVAHTFVRSIGTGNRAETRSVLDPTYPCGEGRPARSSRRRGIRPGLLNWPYMKKDVSLKKDVSFEVASTSAGTVSSKSSFISPEAVTLPSTWSSSATAATGGSCTNDNGFGSIPPESRLSLMSPKPFSAEDFAARMERGGRMADEAGLSGVLVTPGPDLLYLTGYAPFATERLTMLVLSDEREPALIVPVLERPDAESAPGSSRLTLSDWADGSDPYEAAAPLLDPKGRYAISDSAWAMHVLGLQGRVPDSSYVAMTQALPMLRAVKDADELERLTDAGKAADAAFYDILEVQFSGRKETEVAADLADALRAHGHSQVEFTVVGSGPNGANPHHEIGERVIEDGDMVVLDFGGILDGYGSDTTRTVHVGEPTDEERTVHEIVEQAQQAGFEAVRPGVACQDVDRAARKVVADAGYGEHFIHRTGHGIGLATHEPPYMVEGEEHLLEPGMCFSVEPGIYLRDRFGVRIEDIVAVTEDGGRRLNATPRDLKLVA